MTVAGYLNAWPPLRHCPCESSPAKPSSCLSIRALVNSSQPSRISVLFLLLCLLACFVFFFFSSQLLQNFPALAGPPAWRPKSCLTSASQSSTTPISTMRSRPSRSRICCARKPPSRARPWKTRCWISCGASATRPSQMRHLPVDTPSSAAHRQRHGKSHDQLPQCHRPRGPARAQRVLPAFTLPALVSNGALARPPFPLSPLRALRLDWLSRSLSHTRPA